MTDYILRRHVERVCTPTLNNDEVLHCGTCPFEELILEVAPELVGNFKLKRKLINKKHDNKKNFRDNN